MSKLRLVGRWVIYQASLEKERGVKLRISAALPRPRPRPRFRLHLTIRMVSLTHLLLHALFTPALCRTFSLPYLPLETRDDVLGKPPPKETPNHPLQITFTSGPSNPSSLPTLELLAARRALLKLKTLLGPSALKSLVAPDIASGTSSWEAILSSAHDNASSPDPSTRVLASVAFSAVPPDCDAVPKFSAGAFAGWFADTAFRRVEKLWAGHPEHYFIAISQNGDGTLAAELVEPWGPWVTHTKVPRLAPVTGQAGGGVRMPWMKERREFPVQMVGQETLVGGSSPPGGSGGVVGDLHYSFRDVERKGKPGKVCGIELVLDMWMPSGTPAEVKEGISQHLAVEYYNWVGWAYEDIKSGAYVPA